MQHKDTKSKAVKQKAPVSKPKVKDRITKTQSDELKGLCVNCDNRFNCLMSHQPGGVWYCEEFE